MKTTIKVILLFILALALSFIPYSPYKTNITIEFLLTCSSGLFGVSLTVLALLFTILDRYKEKLEHNVQNDILERSLPILKNVCDDVMGMLFIVITLFIIDLLSKPLEILQGCAFFSKIDLNRALLLILLIILLALAIDITYVIVKLINGLFYISKQSDDKIINLSLDERNLVLTTRKLDKKYMAELLEYMKTIIIKQEIDKTNK